MDTVITGAIGAAIPCAMGLLYLAYAKLAPKLKAWWSKSGSADLATIKADVAGAHAKIASFEAQLGAELPALKASYEALKARLDKANIAA